MRRPIRLGKLLAAVMLPPDRKLAEELRRIMAQVLAEDRARRARRLN